MAYQIIWTAEADNDFYSIIHYLKEHWSDYSAEKFAHRALKKLERIAEMPYEPRFTSQPAIQMIKLDKKNVLFYTIENNYMILLSIYPYKRDITKSKYY
ncbi:type II toxin-antitoxin system RelE/ParE family toxin [Ferruginibacter paludis]|uniref:type II toxin-antitoxin system RelE/ParE family toxin n=1 Tax=Ferruginibacter paludis TaxID=1310417 RepID=UPI0025B4D5F8|nr:type II toxin-antitoxin system RelE/ParE family toxin [Ferruginibacter paludis]MDN3659183.1 type II toxin-antitoxin system RelE/ParE family toxin [Ferruginibacter paludis]